MNTDPTPVEHRGIRVAIIEGSMRCFAHGCIGLIPILGAPFAWKALAESRRVSQFQSLAWNPARVYLRVGSTLACLGTLLTVAAIGTILVAIAANFVNG